MECMHTFLVVASMMVLVIRSLLHIDTISSQLEVRMDREVCGCCRLWES